MNQKRTLTILILLIAAALAAVFLLSLLRPAAAGEEEEIAADMAVHVGEIRTADLRRTVTAYGRVAPEPAGPGRLPADSEVSSPVAGVLARVECAEGQRVAKGAILFRLDGRVAEVALDKANKALAFAQDTYDRQSKLLPVEGTSKKALLEAEQALNAARGDVRAAETDLALTRIQAPLAGTVVKINTEPGEAVDLTTVLAVLVDLDRLVAEVEVPGREAAGLRAGQPALFETGEPAGTILYVGSRIDEKNDAITVRTSLPAGAGLLPGRFLSLRLVVEEKAGCLAVPEAAVIADTVGADSGAIVLLDGDKAVRKPVKLGLREAGLIQVEAEGLKPGLPLVVEDAYAVPDGVKVHVVGGGTAPAPAAGKEGR